MSDSTEKATKQSFVQNLKIEFHKIAWPDKQTVTKQAVAVVAVSIVVGLIIAAIDFIAQYGINFLTSI